MATSLSQFVKETPEQVTTSSCPNSTTPLDIVNNKDEKSIPFDPGAAGGGNKATSILDRLGAPTKAEISTRRIIKTNLPPSFVEISYLVMVITLIHYHSL